MTCRLGSVYVKPIIDETNEMSYLVKACEVNVFNFLYLLKISFQVKTTTAYCRIVPVIVLDHRL